MLRTLCVVLGLLATTLSNAGCRSCSSCHDYDGPVAGCDCGGGSCSSCNSCNSGGCDSGCCGSGGGCGCCTTRTGSNNGAYAAPVPGEYPEGYVEGEGQLEAPAPEEAATF